MDKKNTGPEGVPKWDVALAALVHEVYNQRKVPLRMADLQRLCTQYAIRFDDMLVNMFELCIHHIWHYQDAAGRPQMITRDTLTALQAQGRLSEEILKEYTGGWRPASEVKR